MFVQGNIQSKLIHTKKLVVVVSSPVVIVRSEALDHDLPLSVGVRNTAHRPGVEFIQLEWQTLNTWCILEKILF